MHKKRMFKHSALVDVMNQEKIIRFNYSGDMRKLRDKLSQVLLSWEDCYYQDLRTGNGGHMINR